MRIDGRNANDTLAACCYSMGYMETYMQGEYAPHYPMPALRIPRGKIHALSMGCWLWYWYISGFNYR